MSNDGHVHLVRICEHRDGHFDIARGRVQWVDPLQRVIAHAHCAARSWQIAELQ